MSASTGVYFEKNASQIPNLLDYNLFCIYTIIM